MTDKSLPNERAVASDCQSNPPPTTYSWHQVAKHQNGEGQNAKLKASKQQPQQTDDLMMPLFIFYDDITLINLFPVSTNAVKTWKKLFTLLFCIRQTKTSNNSWAQESIEQKYCYFLGVTSKARNTALNKMLILHCILCKNANVY